MFFFLCPSPDFRSFSRCRKMKGEKKMDMFSLVCRSSKGETIEPDNGDSFLLFSLASIRPCLSSRLSDISSPRWLTDFRSIHQTVWVQCGNSSVPLRREWTLYTERILMLPGLYVDTDGCARDFLLRVKRRCSANRPARPSMTRS